MGKIKVAWNRLVQSIRLKVLNFDYIGVIFGDDLVGVRNEGWIVFLRILLIAKF